MVGEPDWSAGEERPMNGMTYHGDGHEATPDARISKSVGQMLGQANWESECFAVSVERKD